MKIQINKKHSSYLGGDSNLLSYSYKIKNLDIVSTGEINLFKMKPFESQPHIKLLF